MRLHTSNTLLMNKLSVFGYGPVQTMAATHPCLPNTKAATKNQFPKLALRECLEQGRTIDMCSSIKMLNPSSVWRKTAITTNACTKNLYCWNRIIVSKKSKQQPQQYTRIKTIEKQYHQWWNYKQPHKLFGW